MSIETEQLSSKMVNGEYKWKKWLFRPELSTIILFIITCWISSRLSPYFADIGYILDSTSMYIEYGIVALTMTFIIVSGEIDLSVASAIALVGCVTATVFNAGVSMGWSIVIGLLLGIFLGMFNGLIITKLELPSIIVTIGTMTLYRGIAQILLGDHSLGHFPGWFQGIDYHYIGIFPFPLIIFLILAVIMGLILKI